MLKPLFLKTTSVLIISLLIRKKDIVIEGIGNVYYKVYQPDSILVICPQWNPKRDVIDNVNNINIHITGLPYDLNKDELINEGFIEIRLE